MWQVGRIKQIGIFLIMVLGIGYQVQAQDQTVKINIQLPAGVGLSAGGGSNSGSAAQGGEDGGSNRIANSVVDFAVISENGTLIPLSWIKMQALENSQFMVDFRKVDGSSMKTTCYFLNTSTDLLQEALPVALFPAVMQFNREPRLIRNFVPRRTSVYSWIGVPNDPSMTMVIEYF
ncbi:MAG: hypothetical protein KGZ90_17590 [Algoriphagus sp.]|nr:hypothetical protein [Algoriphagus sp.]